MNAISFTDIYYPLMTDPRYKMLSAIRSPLTCMLHHAKRYRNGDGQFSWEHMHEAYNELRGTVNAFYAIGMITHNDMFRIPFIAYRTAMKIACNR